MTIQNLDQHNLELTFYQIGKKRHTNRTCFSCLLLSERFLKIHVWRFVKGLRGQRLNRTTVLNDGAFGGILELRSLGQEPMNGFLGEGVRQNRDRGTYARPQDPIT